MPSTLHGRYQSAFRGGSRAKEYFGVTARPFQADPQPSLRIPMKWGTDSDEVGQHQSEATLVMAMITEVPHFSQVFLAW